MMSKQIIYRFQNLMPKQILFVLLLGTTPIMSENLSAQETQLSLNQAIEMAQQKNYQTVNAKTDIDIAKQKIVETTASGLPQVNSKFSANNYPKLPTFGPDNTPMVPETGRVFTLEVNQLLFSAAYFIGLRSAKNYLSLYENNYEKALLEIKKSATQAYINVLVNEETIHILKENLNNITKNVEDTKKLLQNGFTEEENLEQLELLQTDAQTALNNAQNLRDITKEHLRLSIGLPSKHPLELTENLDKLTIQSSAIPLINHEDDLSNNIDRKISTKNRELQKLNLQYEVSRKLPTINGNFTYNEGNETLNTSTFVAMEVNVPVFSSFQWLSRVKQARSEWKKAKLVEKETVRMIQLAYDRTLTEYQQALDTHKSAIKSVRISKKIVRKNEIKYHEGLATSFDIVRTYQQLHQAQQNYLSACATLINKKIELETIINN